MFNIKQNYYSDLELEIAKYQSFYNTLALASPNRISYSASRLTFYDIQISVHH